MSDNTPEVTVADILDRAADLIEPEGAWTRGAYAIAIFGETPCYCAVGAINAATGRSLHSASSHPAIDALSDTIGHFSVVKWNDTPGRTQAEVVAALRQAATAERATGAA